MLKSQHTFATPSLRIFASPPHPPTTNKIPTHTPHLPTHPVPIFLPHRPRIPAFGNLRTGGIQERALATTSGMIPFFFQAALARARFLFF